MVEAAAKNDSEPYVRASALRCLTLMVKIRLLWEHSLVKLNLMVSFFSINQRGFEIFLSRRTT